ncbi:MAG: DUF2909 domain-containing protein [Gammaproteobacteria bacterium WSBS_2016_MAG_OTU1]
MLRIVAILLLCFIIINLFVGLFYVLRGGKRGTKTVRALTIRVAASVLLFIIILLSAKFGVFPE